ncbi:PREDICTED: ribulose-1,5 bisphosphate carboxylase/oxygenase large subunit N-methyltransferase, chloroplastic [Tarenaya hassleriana]|uniref:ribulose-1,5 bisphosphate carboxylase/oxygenase large subunit N-methyltransferase, chloroplastic n=1 Tax=Tarenaya hassleriana TaxID=28532 RepID=UPI00053C2002|nr:PREDICTED: ribulose-1,5 bisphosphate carboxylase/oxygenase large subunit N-methyltransferase, chloroplastic [Tarenaya hassleriana]XP_019056701.1 PREDICTED: ribulose-1,5 bisphosphate carboxylase/oxygenase large subunit N-methyltransferase, chloroplastic [Tarenaya hassleriana]
MAEASIVLQSALFPTLSPFHKLHRDQHSTLSFPSPAVARRRQVVHCSVSAGEAMRRASVEEDSPEISWGCEVDSVENATSLQRWLSDSGLPPQKMAIDKVSIGERGLVASKNIRKGEKLLFVPPSLVITSDSKWSKPEAGELMKRYDVPDWPLLATYLISEASLGNDSVWYNYISALPRQPYSLLYWTRAELDRYLEASQIRERAIERVTNVLGTYDDLRSRIFSKHPLLFPEEVFNVETFIWSFGILFSRLVRLPSMDGRFALVPWADMLNHNCEVKTFLDYDKSSKGVVFTTDRPYQPGEQVFISYGNKSNGELLLSYGFVPGEGTNPSDSVELSVSLRKTDKCYKEKLDALRKHGLTTPQCFPIRVTGWPLELMAYAYLVASPSDMRNRFDEMAAAASNKSTTKKDIKFPEIEEEALQFILDSCEASISKYSKFLQASGSMDLDITSPKQLNRRVFLKQLAVDLCNSERRILYRAQYILRRRLRDIRSGELKALRLFNGLRNLFK